MAILDYLDLYLRKWKRYDSHQSRKRLLITLLAICIILVYIGPFFFKFWQKKPKFQDLTEPCFRSVGAYLKILQEEERFEAHRWNNLNPVTESSDHYLPYVGNGKIGLPLDNYSDKPFYILSKRALDLPLPFHPLIEIEIANRNGFKQGSTSVRYVQGHVLKVTCYTYFAKDVSIKETIYAHRLINNLLVQEIDIINHTDAPFIFSFKRLGWKGDPKVKSQVVPINAVDKLNYFQIQSQIDWKDDNRKSIGFSVIAPEIPNTIEVPHGGRKTIEFRTFLNYTKPILKNQISRYEPDLRISLRETVKRVAEISSLNLFSFHRNAWSELWKSGFGISLSKAQNVLNGDAINATLYYLLSHKNAFDADYMFKDLPSALISMRSSSLLNKPDSCYNGHPTLQASALWSPMDSISDINRIVSLWLMTLEKHGCHNLIESGAMGTLQAYILSLSALKFTKNHIEFNTHPQELHRDYYIRRLNYGNNTSLNITVALGEDNKASIYVAIDKNEGDHKFYACDGGCMDAPIKLSSIPIQFPVKLTQPLTAILYITPDLEHIQELKHTIHVKEIVEAPAHEHNIIALHRHGHKLGGLPAIFWLSIVFLIVIFHLFLAKLIYNEYCVGSSSSSSSSSSSGYTYERVRYAV
ncbi:uncharacterized protein KIAA2013 homolog [Panonychus citri]|uniref:uncharacterized protein KIAA2013 homolog n=1 Tax=Panonychus citri TaxID=50023 RepID=UPI002307859D|nr:uncharacterized protein KIAA2013 homolog [Panonychus citri]